MNKLSLNEELYKIHKLIFNKNIIVEYDNNSNKLNKVYQLLIDLKSIISKGEIEKPAYERYNEDVKSVQKILVLLGYGLPKYGTDGLYGKETQGALNKFALDNNIEYGSFGVTGPILQRMMLLLKDRYVRILAYQKYSNRLSQPARVEPDANVPSQKQEINKKNDFLTNIDLSTEEGFKKYADICQAYISTKKYNYLEITGEMMATGAQNAFYKYGKYVPPELALSQLVLEGGLGNPDPNVKPVRTKNPFNFQNTDDGNIRKFPSVQDGINTYYNLIAREYLHKDNTLQNLFTNFVRPIKGGRYASDVNYESKLKSIASKVNQIAKNFA